MVPTDASGAPRERRLPDDVVADLLDAERRRYVLEALARERNEMSVDDVAAVVRARECDVDPDAIDRSERGRVRDELFQQHLPKLIATDVVRYDSMLGTIELADRNSVDEAIDRS